MVLGSFFGYRRHALTGRENNSAVERRRQTAVIICSRCQQGRSQDKTDLRGGFSSLDPPLLCRC